MTELQMGLLGLGGAAVVAVVAYNKWQDYRHRKLAEQLLKAQHIDVLLDEREGGEPESGNIDRAPEINFNVEAHELVHNVPPPIYAEPESLPVDVNERIEPVLHFESEPREPVMARRLPPAEPEAVVEPESAPAPAPLSEPVPTPVPMAALNARDIPEPLHLLSPAVDYVASFEAVEPATSFQILDAQRDVLARIRKPIHWIGFNELAREWEPIIDDGVSQYRCLQVGLQLVDRQGPLSESDLSVFLMAMQDLAEQMMAITDLPPRQSALDAAAKLDQFCASVDIQIGINVVSQAQVFPGTKLRALAEAAGMVIDGEGRFVRCDEDGNVLYVLLNQEAAGFSAEAMKTMTTRGVTFLLDVPHVAHGERVFNQMVDLAKRFADVLRGALVDDNRRPLSEAALEPIRKQVVQFQSAMAAQKLPAGSSITRRLFS